MQTKRNNPSMSTTTPPDPWPLPELTRARRAIVVVDVVESVRLMQEDEAGFIERWRRFVHQVRNEVLPNHGGRLVKSLGDGMLLEFERVPQAMRAALSLQMIAHGEPPLPVRIGAHVSEVSIDELDLFGSGVNLASRVAALAEPGQVVVTSALRDELVDGLDADLEDLGPCWLKHINLPVHAFAVRSPTSARQPASDTAPMALSVAVMPLMCMGGAAEHGALGDFIADALIAGLSLAPELKVLSRLSTRAVRDRTLSAVDSGRQLGAKYLLSGSYVIHGRRAAIDVEMADAEDGAVAWTGRCACEMGSLFEHPSEPLETLASDVHRALLDHESRRVRSRPLPNLASYSLLLGSIGLLHCTTVRDFDRARQALDALIQREPRHGAAYAWLTKWHFLRMIRGLAASPQREREEAKRRVDQALHRDVHSSTAWALKGLVHAYEHRLSDAQSAYTRALECNPSEPLAWLYLGTLRSWQGRGTEAVEAARRALALSPLDPVRYYFESLAAAAMLSDRRFDEAIAMAERSLRVHRGHTPTFRVLTIAQMLSGREDDACRTLERMRAIEPELTVAQYLDRYPGREAPHAQHYADALRAAGLPD
jgi:adenylate cyclase